MDNAINTEQTTKIPIMTHCISHFPNRSAYHHVVQALVAGGSSHIEIQFPFSDPSGDGPAIQEACRHAIDHGKFTLDDAFVQLQQLIASYPIPFFIMTYANIIFRAGVQTFVERCHHIGVSGLIIPDLPFDADEHLFQITKKYGIETVPVITITSPPERILSYVGQKYVYVSLRTGITGKRTTINNDIIQKLRYINQHFPVVIGGFGIQTPEQVALLAPHVDIVVVGSAIVRMITAHTEGNLIEPVTQFVSSLVQAGNMIADS